MKLTMGSGSFGLVIGFLETVANSLLVHCYRDAGKLLVETRIEESERGQAG